MRAIRMVDRRLSARQGQLEAPQDLHPAHALVVQLAHFKPVPAASEGAVDLGTPVVEGAGTAEGRDHQPRLPDVVVEEEALTMPPTSLEPMQQHNTPSGTALC